MKSPECSGRYICPHEQAADAVTTLHFSIGARRGVGGRPVMGVPTAIRSDAPREARDH